MDTERLHYFLLQFQCYGALPKDTQIAMLNLKADNLANTDMIVANNEAQTAILRQALNPTPVPAYPAQYPSWNNCGCGNNNNYCCA